MPGYTPQSEIQRRQQLIESMGRRADKPGFGGLIDAFGGGRESRAQAQAQGQNEEIQSAETQALIDSLKQGGLQGPTQSGGQPQLKFQTPALQNMQLQQAMGRQTAGQKQQDELAKIRARNERTGSVSGVGAPSSTREWEAYSQLTKEQQEQYLTMKRANPSINLGNEQVFPSQVNPSGTPQASFEVGLRPGEEPAVRGQQATAVAEAQNAAELVQQEAIATQELAQDVERINSMAGLEADAAGQISRAKGDEELSTMEQRLFRTNEIEMELDVNRRLDELATSERKNDLANEWIDEALSMSTFVSTGIPGALTSWVPASPGFKLNSVLGSLEGVIGFDALQEMRANSPTGAALGAINEKELDQLNGIMGSIKASNGKEMLDRNLNRLREALNSIINGAQESFGRDYSDTGRFQVEVVQ